MLYAPEASLFFSPNSHNFEVKCQNRNANGASNFELQAIEDQISSFGQTPSQLFRKRHGKRGPPPAPTYHPLLNGPDTMKLAVVGRPPTRRQSNPFSYAIRHNSLPKTFLCLIQRETSGDAVLCDLRGLPAAFNCSQLVDIQCYGPIYTDHHPEQTHSSLHCKPCNMIKVKIGESSSNMVQAQYCGSRAFAIRGQSGADQRRQSSVLPPLALAKRPAGLHLHRCG